jgi:prephenate dehydrogenase
MERDYDRLLNSEKASAADIIAYNNNLINSLESELELQKQIKQEAENNFNDVYSQIPEEMKQFI